MDFIRPEIQTALWRAREVIVAGVVAGLAVWWAMAALGPVRWVAATLALMAVLYAGVAVQRMRFAQGGGGVGVVQIVERRIAYFGPLTGGVMDLDDLTRLDLIPGGKPSAHWLLTGVGGQEVAIPVDAEGADALFDAFAALPGLRSDRLIDVLSRTPQARALVWQRDISLRLLH